MSKQGMPPAYQQPGPPPHAAMYNAPPPYAPAGATAHGYPQQPAHGYPQQPHATHTTVIVNPQQTRVVQQPSRGLFGGIMNDINKFGKSVDREVNSAVKTINNSFDTCARSSLLDLFVTNNVIQLVSRASGRSLEIVQSPGGLVVDGMGAEGPDAYNAVWTVVSEGNNQVRLHNNNNYLAIVNGNTTIMTMPPGSQHGVETKFQLSVIPNTQFLVIESIKERTKHIGNLESGHIKSALACGREIHSHYGIRLIHSPYGPAGKK